MAEQTSAKVTITTKYGDTPGNYDHSLATKEITITPSNYKNYSTLITEEANTQAAAINETDSYKMLNTVSFPESSQGTYNAACGTQFDYRTELEYGTITVDNISVVIAVKYRVTNSNTSFDTFSTETKTFSASNYESANVDIESARNAALQRLQAYLDTLIGYVPSSFNEVTTTFKTTIGNKVFNVKTTIAKGATSTNATHGGDTQCTLSYTTIYNFNNESSNVTLSTNTFNIVASNYLTYETELANAINAEQAKVQQVAAYKMLNVTFASEISGEYLAKNGITYKYLTVFTQGTADITQNQIGYTTVWGTNTNYGTTYKTDVEVLNTSTYVNAATTLQNDARAHTDALKAYLDTLLGPISLPDDLLQTKAVASGKTFYIKTVFSEFSKSQGANITEYVVQYQTVYGLSKYDQTLNTLTHTININNYATYQADLRAKAQTEQNKIPDLAAYKMLNVSVPASITGEVTATNGIKYYYISTFSQGTADLTSNTIKYTTKCNYDNTYTASKTVTFDTNTYTNAATLCNNAANTEQGNLVDYLNTLIGPVNKLGEQNITFPTTSGQTFYVKTIFNNVGTATATQYNVEIVTQYSLDPSYQANINTYSTQQHTIIASNYLTYEADLNSIASAEQQKIKTLKAYEMLNTQVPEESSGEYTAVNGTTYFYKINFTQGAADLSSNLISGTIQYGTSTSYGIIYSTSNTTLTTATYTGAAALLSDARTNLLTNLEAYLDTLTGRLTVPDVLTKSYNTNSGSILYGRVNFLITKDTETLGTIQYTTEYGLTPNYGSIFSIHELDVTSANYTEYLDTLIELGNAELTSLGSSRTFSMLNVTRPEEITGEYDATNGIKYYYRISYPQGVVTINSNAIKYVTTYGTSQSYGTTYSDKAVVFDTNTYTTAITTLTQDTNEELQSLKQYLNTLNGAVEVPGPRTTVIPTRSGQNIYARTVFNKKAETDTEYVIQYTTEYGLNTNYGTSFSTKTHSITASNYNTYSADLNRLSNDEFEAIKTSDTYGMLNIELPDAVSSSYNATNGLTYYYRVRFTQGVADAVGNSIIYTTEYGTTSSYGTVRSSKSITFIQNTYKDASTILSDAVSNEIDSLKTYLDTIIGRVEVPADKVTTFSTNSGAIIYAKVVFSKKSESATQCIMQYVTEYGTSNSYGTTFSVKTHTIYASN